MHGRYGKEVDEDYFTGWQADPKLAGEGIMLDQGIHMLDLFNIWQVILIKFTPLFLIFTGKVMV